MDRILAGASFPLLLLFVYLHLTLTVPFHTEKTRSAKHTDLGADSEADIAPPAPTAYAKQDEEEEDDFPSTPHGAPRPSPTPRMPRNERETLVVVLDNSPGARMEGVTPSRVVAVRARVGGEEEGGEGDLSGGSYVGLILPFHCLVQSLTLSYLSIYPNKQPRMTDEELDGLLARFIRRPAPADATPTHTNKPSSPSPLPKTPQWVLDHTPAHTKTPTVFKTPKLKTQAAGPSTMNRAQFKRERERLTQELYAEFNERIFGGRLPGGLEITWSEKLRTTAGLTHYK